MTRYAVSVPVTVICLVVLVFGVGCDSNAKNDALIGGGVGTGAGAIIGHQSGKTGQGALIGGAIGAGAGYLLGDAQDKKKQETATPTKSEKQDAANIVTVNVTNSNGSFTPVKLTKQGENNYVGPKGKVYDHLPTEAELKPVYGF
ncbi:MAG: glycine zipper domain-containing protein [Sedimentisphaerales bacterium]